MKVDLRKTDIIIIICIIILIIALLSVYFFRNRVNDKYLFMEKVKTVYKGSMERFAKETIRTKESGIFYIGRVDNKNCHMDVYDEDKIGEGVNFFVSVDPHGNIIDFAVSNEKYQYYHRNNFKIADIHIEDIEDINEENKVVFSCDGVYK